MPIKHTREQRLQTLLTAFLVAAWAGVCAPPVDAAGQPPAKPDKAPAPALRPARWAPPRITLYASGVSWRQVLTLLNERARVDYAIYPDIPDYPITIRIDGMEYQEALHDFMQQMKSEGIPLTYHGGGVKVFLRRRGDDGVWFRPPANATKIADGTVPLFHTPPEEAAAFLRPMLPPDATVSVIPGRNAVRIRCPLKSYQKIAEALYLLEMASALRGIDLR